MSEMTRSKTYLDAVSTVIGASSINKSEVFKDFETYGYGGAKVQVVAEDLAEVTSGPVDVNVYVSFDEGDTYVLAANDQTLTNGSGSSSAVSTIKVAPRVKVELETGSGEGISADAGAAVHVLLEEADLIQGERKTVITKNVEVSGGADVYSDIMACDSVPSTVYFGATVVDTSGATAAGTSETSKVTLESSLDGVNFWTVDATGVTLSSESNIETYIFDNLNSDTKNFGTYFRLKITDSASTTEFVTSSGLSLIMISEK